MNPEDFDKRLADVLQKDFTDQRMPNRQPFGKDTVLTPQQIERLQGISGVSYGKLMQMQYFGTLYQFCKERGITEL